MLTKNRADLQNFADATRHEWLETNGLGGWSSASVIGANTRRYHGLLVAAIEPHLDRYVLLSKLDETIVVHNNAQPGDNGQFKDRFELGVNLYQGHTIFPKGNQYLTEFNKDLFPEWTYAAGGIQLRKKIVMIHEENTVVVIYDVIKASSSFILELLPLIASRNYHSLNHQGPHMHWHSEFHEGVFHNQPDGNLNIFIKVPGSSFKRNPSWYRNFLYTEEQNRGLDHIEDLFNHGIFAVQLQEGDSLSIIISDSDPSMKDGQELFTRELHRRQNLLYQQPDNGLIKQLVLAADQFIIKRKMAETPEASSLRGSLEGTSIIAGYHWFTDWGRDTMISLPGLCLSTGRFADAKKILTAYAASVNMGMLPNRFCDDGKTEYNSADATLWYFIAVYKYLVTTGDVLFVLNDLLPVLKEIIDWHFKGTRYNIHVDEDGLLSAGEQGVQLTWMDAKVGKRVITPRMGKPVEIQALWYNALKIFAELLQLNNQAHDAWVVGISADKVKESFLEKFWYQEGNYLYDVIDEEGDPNKELRPNQLFAISLPFALIEGEQAKAVLKVVEEQLYTPVGLRTLSPNDPHYFSLYKGDVHERDEAYHQGTVWAWLLGPYVDALMKVKSEKSKVKNVIDNFAYHLNEACIGSVSEIFDGEAPHLPKGCIAQAWSVAELLRVIKDYQLYDEPKQHANIETGEITEVH